MKKILFISMLLQSVESLADEQTNDDVEILQGMRCICAGFGAKVSRASPISKGEGLVMDGIHAVEERMDAKMRDALKEAAEETYKVLKAKDAEADVSDPARFFDAFNLVLVRVLAAFGSEPLRQGRYC